MGSVDGKIAGPLHARPVVAVVGATATGKSSFAEDLAVRLDGEIVSADSMQVYRGMDIGTAKVPVHERRVPYHCIDVVDPGQPFSAALYQRLARESIETVYARGKVPIVCGGTGLYVKAALDNLIFPAGEQVGNEVRDRYLRLAGEHGADWLHSQLEQVDKASADLIAPNNVRRVVRAFEMLADGTSYAEQRSHASELLPYYDTVYLGLSVTTGVLYERIDSRVDEMLADGLLEEVRHLVDAGFAEAITSSQAIGYKEFLPFLDSQEPLDSEAFLEAAECVKRSTRRYAKRQRTWFKRDARINWIAADEPLGQAALQQALELIRLHG